MVIGFPQCSSTLHSAKFFPDGWKKSPKFSAMSCRASKLASHENEATNYYSLLSLSSTQAGTDEIKRAYRTMALKFHPDVYQDPSVKIESAKKFVLLKQAYETLSDHLTRAEYDYELGLCDSGKALKGRFSDGYNGRIRWEGQIVELRKRSNISVGEKEGSWGSRVRYRNNRDKEMR